MSEFVAGYLRLGRAEREWVRSNLTMDDFYTLMTFSRRNALSALRTRDPDAARAAVVALSAIALGRVDWRDVHVAAALAYHTVRRVGLDPAGVATDAAGRAEPEVAELLT